MIRLIIFLVGLLMFLAGAASNFESIPLPFNLKTTSVSIGSPVFSLDVVFMMAGIFLMLIAWVFTRLNQ